MPKEIRKLVFTAQEIETAVGVYLDATKATARSKHVISVALQSGADLGALVKLSIALPGGRNEIVLTTEQLGVALIVYCKKTGIPLPKKGKKSVERDGGGIVMEITVN